MADDGHATFWHGRGALRYQHIYQSLPDAVRDVIAELGDHYTDGYNMTLDAASLISHAATILREHPDRLDLVCAAAHLIEAIDCLDKAAEARLLLPKGEWNA